MSIAINNCHINKNFYNFINNEVLTFTSLENDAFWQALTTMLIEFTPKNTALLNVRQRLQQHIDEYHKTHKTHNEKDYLTFLQSIDYLIDEPADFSIETRNLDTEIVDICGPQLVVPIKNARFALNAANARWGSLYDALYGTDALGDKPGSSGYDEIRGNKVIAWAKDFLDRSCPLVNGHYKDVSDFAVVDDELIVTLQNGETTQLQRKNQFVASLGEIAEKGSILLKNNNLHIEIIIDHQGAIGKKDCAGIHNIILESATTTIMDLEDSIAAVDSEDKIDAYRNWLGLITGTLNATFDKNGKEITRNLRADKTFIGHNGSTYVLPGRSLMLIRNVGYLMMTDLVKLPDGSDAPEGLIDAAVTILIASIGLHNPSACRHQNSRTGSIYVVKPKMHGPDEVAFACETFARVEAFIGLAANTVKIGIMDEERRTSLNLKACIKKAKNRVFFINTGFLDRTGDEIHTSMHAGAFLPKNELKNQVWIHAYEKNNVVVGLKSGFKGKAQIGKGMWAMPDEMEKMLAQKTEHLEAGANTAWVPSPSAATLHALHYHQIDVFSVQEQLDITTTDLRSQMLQIPLLDRQLSADEIEKELQNNVQSILGYVVRWVEMGIGCSKVPDIHNVGLMEDRATLRISSQHIANWLCHNICTKAQIEAVIVKMAALVDHQNQGQAGYVPMAENIDGSLALNAARALIFEGEDAPSGYTEPSLHKFRQRAKQAQQ